MFSRSLLCLFFLFPISGQAISIGCNSMSKKILDPELTNTYIQFEKIDEKFMFLELLSGKGMYYEASKLARTTLLNDVESEVLEIPGFLRYGIDCDLYEHIENKNLNKKNWAPISDKYRALLKRKGLKTAHLIYEKLSYGYFHIEDYNNAIKYAVFGLEFHETLYTYELLLNSFFKLKQYLKVVAVYKSLLEKNSGYEKSQIITLLSAYSYATLGDYLSARYVLYRHAETDAYDGDDKKLVEVVQRILHMAVKDGYSENMSEWKDSKRKKNRDRPRLIPN